MNSTLCLLLRSRLWVLYHYSANYLTEIAMSVQRGNCM